MDRALRLVFVLATLTLLLVGVAAYQTGQIRVLHEELDEVGCAALNERQRRIMFYDEVAKIYEAQEAEKPDQSRRDLLQAIRAQQDAVRATIKQQVRQNPCQE